HRVRPAGATEPGLQAVSHCFQGLQHPFFVAPPPPRGNNAFFGGRTAGRGRGTSRRADAMRDRLNQNDVTNQVDVEDPVRVRDAVLDLFSARYPGEDLAPLAYAFDDFKSLF